MGLTYMGKTIWTKGFGVIAKNNPKLGPPNETTIFRIGSVSKVFSVSSDQLKYKNERLLKCHHLHRY